MIKALIRQGLSIMSIWPLSSLYKTTLVMENKCLSIPLSFARPFFVVLHTSCPNRLHRQTVLCPTKTSHACGVFYQHSFCRVVQTVYWKQLENKAVVTYFMSGKEFSELLSPGWVHVGTKILELSARYSFAFFSCSCQTITKPPRFPSLVKIK